MNKLKKSDLMALDRSSARTIDEFGRMHIVMTPISKANVCPYVGREIPNSEGLGLDQNKIYFLYRDPEELAKGAPTFNNCQILSTHVPVTATDPKKEIVAGSTGTDTVFKAPYLLSTVVIWDSVDIDLIQSEKKKQLSACYRYDADMTPGEVDGIKFDGVMRNIVGNHVALVEEGRAGPDVYAADNKLLESTMKLSRKAVQVRGALKAYLLPKLAADSYLKTLGSETRALVSNINQSNYSASKESLKKAIETTYLPKLAKDADLEDVIDLLELLDDKTDLLDESDSPLMTIDEEVDVVDEDDDVGGLEDDNDMLDAAAVIAMLEGKVSAEMLASIRSCLTPAAQDESKEKDEPPMKKSDKDGKTAMDAAIKAAKEEMRKEMLAIREAEEIVQPFVGKVAAMDSAESIYRYALDAKGVDLKGVHPSAFKVILQNLSNGNEVTQRVSMASDSKSLDVHARLFPNAVAPKRG